MKATRNYGEKNPLVFALALSLIIHLLFFGTWKLGKQLGWWRHESALLMKLNLSKWLAKPLPKEVKKPQLRPREIPMSFIEVDPAVAVAEPPKEAKFYSAQNARATAPDLTVESPVPKVDGKQTQVARLENVAKPNPVPLQPAPPPEKAKPAEPAPPKAKKEPPLGDLPRDKPKELDKPKESQAELGSGEALSAAPDRPRTLAAARARKAMLTGEKMKQDGGTRQRGNLSFDVKATAFGAYDAAFIAAVQQRWYDLLESTPYTQRSGKVIVEFRLNYDGRISDIRAVGNEVGELLALICQRAILDPAPFARWPTDMRRAIGANYRDVTFTFYYN